MKASYILFVLAASITAIASPVSNSDTNIYDGAKPKRNDPHRALDPPPAPTPFPLNTDGVLADGSIINYLPDPPNVIYHSCWTAPKSRPPPNQRYIYGKCSVCMVQRNGTDGSADYQLWARDMDNNAMGNMYATTVSPIDDKKPDHPVNASMIMGRWPLLLQAKKNEKNLAKVKLLWTTPPLDPHNPAIWSDRRAQFTTFIPGNSDAGFTGCADAGSALNGAVRYAQCAFDCWEDMRP